VVELRDGMHWLATLVFDPKPGLFTSDSATLKLVFWKIIGWSRKYMAEQCGGCSTAYRICRFLCLTVPQQIRFIAHARSEAVPVDANDILYSLSSSADYDPRPGLATIKTKVYALNFADDEFNPAELHVLEELMPRVRQGRFIVQPGSRESFGQLTMEHPELWSDRVAEFMRELGDDGAQSSKPRLVHGPVATR
jgi:hypothetical protein